MSLVTWRHTATTARVPLFYFKTLRRYFGLHLFVPMSIQVSCFVRDSLIFRKNYEQLSNFTTCCHGMNISGWFLCETLWHRIDTHITYCRKIIQTSTSPAKAVNNLSWLATHIFATTDSFSDGLRQSTCHVSWRWNNWNCAVVLRGRHPEEERGGEKRHWREKTEFKMRS